MRHGDHEARIGGRRIHVVGSVAVIEAHAEVAALARCRTRSRRPQALRRSDGHAERERAFHEAAPAQRAALHFAQQCGQFRCVT